MSFGFCKKIKNTNIYIYSTVTHIKDKYIYIGIVVVLSCISYAFFYKKFLILCEIKYTKNINKSIVEHCINKSSVDNVFVDFI